MHPGFTTRITISIKNKIRLISLFILFIPVYFFTIGDLYGSGFQTPLFRYQDIFLGSFLVLISNDVNNIFTGFSTGIQVPIVLLWCLGSFFLVMNIVLLFVDRAPIGRIIRWSGILILISGLFFLFSLILHYGPLFHNRSDIAIPLGLPLIFLIGVWMFQFEVNDENTADEEQPVH
jgi:hypothetical protein